MADNAINITLTIDGKQAQAVLQNTRQGVSNLVSEFNMANLSGTNAMQEVASETLQPVRSISLLENQISRLRADLNSSEIGGDAFRSLSAQVGLLTNELAEARSEAAKFAVPVGFNQLGKQSTDAKMAMVGLNYTLRDSPYLFQNLNMGIMAVSNNIGPMIDNMLAMKRESGSMGGFVRTLARNLAGPAGLSLAFSAVVAVIQIFSFVSAKAESQTKKLSNAQLEAAERAGLWKKETQELNDELSKLSDAEIGINISNAQERLQKIDAEITRLKNTITEESSSGLQVDTRSYFLAISLLEDEKKGILANIDTLQKEKEQKGLLANIELELIRLEKLRKAARSETDIQDFSKQIEAQEKIRNSLIQKGADSEIEMNRLRIMTIKGEREKELAELGLWYLTEQNKAGENDQKLLLLKQVYDVKRQEIEKKYTDIKIKDEREQAALVAELEIEALKDGREKDLKELDAWYNTRLAKAKNNAQAIALLDAAKTRREQEITVKYDRQDADAKALAAKRGFELAELSLENESDSAKLTAKQQYYNSLLNIYSGDLDRQKEIAHEIALLQGQINNAILKETKDASDKRGRAAELVFENQIKAARLAGQSERDVAQLVLNHKLQKLAEVKAAVYANADDQKIAVEEANAGVLDAQDNFNRATLDKDKNTAEKRREILSNTWAQLTAFLSDYYNNEADAQKEAIDKEQDRRNEILKTEREQRLAHAYTQSARDRINRDYDAKEKRLEQEMTKRKEQAAIKAFEVNQATSVINATINTLTAATSALQTQPVWLGIAMAAIITGLGMKNVTQIANQSPPKYAEGGLFIGRGGSKDDQNLAWISNKEYIVRNAMTEKHFNLIEAVNNDRITYGDPKHDLDESGIITAIEALRKDVRDQNKEISRLAHRPVNAKTHISKYDSAAIVEYGSYEENKSKL